MKQGREKAKRIRRVNVYKCVSDSEIFHFFAKLSIPGTFERTKERSSFETTFERTSILLDSYVGFTRVVQPFGFSPFPTHRPLGQCSDVALNLRISLTE